MFTNNPNMISNASMIFYHGIELPSTLYNKGVLDIINVPNELIDELVEKINNKDFTKMSIFIKYGNCTTNSIALHFKMLDAYKNDNVFTVQFVIYNKHIGNCELCACNYQIIKCCFDDSISSGYVIENTIHK